MAIQDPAALGRSDPSDRGPAPRHAERLAVPWWWWLSAVAVVAGLAAEVWLGAPGVQSWLPFALLLPVTVTGLWRLGRIEVAVTDDEFRVDDARLPVRFVADAIPIDAAGKRMLLGPGTDPLAFVVQRPWISGAVQVLLDDPADPTPYWLVSSRNPVRLAAAVQAARDEAAGVRDSAADAPDSAGRARDEAAGIRRGGPAGD